MMSRRIVAFKTRLASVEMLARRRERGRDRSFTQRTLQSPSWWTKWDKTKVRFQWVSCQLEEGPNVEHKPLERVRGFLNYVMPVYPSMIPYLRGFHGALDSWRSNRTADGFDKPLNKEGRRI
jgi:hypothetical protein